MCLKVIAQGFILHRDSYLRNFCNFNDFLVVLSGLLEMIIADNKVLKLIRVSCRPMKLVYQVQSIKQLIYSLIASLPEFTNIGIFKVFIFVLFATMGLQKYCGGL